MASSFPSAAATATAPNGPRNHSKSPPRQQPQPPLANPKPGDSDAATVALPILAEALIADAVEYHSDVIIHGCEDEEDPVAHWESLVYFWKLLDGSTSAAISTTNACTSTSTNAGTATAQQKENLADVIDTGAAQRVLQPQPQLHSSLHLHRSKYGRIKNRKLMAQILMFACHLDAFDYVHDNSYNHHDHLRNQSSALLLDISPMCQWKRRQWKWLKKKLEMLRQSLMRVDAHLPVLKVQDENCAIDSRRLNHPIFAKKYDKLITLLEVNEILSLIRPEIEKQLRASTNENPSPKTVRSQHEESDIAQEDLQAFRQAVAEVGNPRAQNFLEQFLRYPREEPSTQNRTGQTQARNRLCLMPVRDIRQAMESDGCNLGKVQAKLTVLVREWAAYVFKGRRPALRRLGYGTADVRVHAHDSSFSAKEYPDETYLSHKESSSLSPPALPTTTTTNQRIQDMHLARRNLESSFQDPLPDSITTAERALILRQRRTQQERKSNDINKRSAEQDIDLNAHNSSRNKRMKSAQALHFQDSDDDDVAGYEAVDAPVQLSNLTNASNNNDDIMQNRDYKSSGGGKRKRFTLEEKQAICKGVRRHGVGKWADIKADFALVLKSRTNVQIKDCYRTMKRNGEID